MRVSHEFDIVASCPVNKAKDSYRLILRTGRILKVEDILATVEKLTEHPIFQEDLTQAIYRELGCEVETRGLHSGVLTTVICGE